MTLEENGERSATLSVGGMRCAACSWLLEERLARVPGVSTAQFGLANQRARVRWDPEVIALSAILAHIAELGYRAEPFEPDAEEALLRGERRAALRRLGASGLGTMQVMMFSVALYAGAFADLEAVHRDLLRFASLVVTTPVLAYAGLPFLTGAWRDLRAVRIGPDVPIGLALLGAYAASAWSTVTGSGEVYFDSVCMFIFFITLGRALERDLRARAELRIRSLQRRVPQIAHRLAAGEAGEVEEDVPAASLTQGDLASIHPGEYVPADGLLIEGQGEVSESLLTGEESPVLKQPGSPLFAGSENLDGTLQMRVERTGAASTLQQIATLLDRAQLEKPPIAELADRLARVFLTSVVAAALAVGLMWWWIDPSRIVPVVISVLIATCPCALSLATPTALAAATHGLAARGFLITRGHALEALARATRVVFDKTGTLTAATPMLRAVHPIREQFDAGQAIRLATELEANSNHPLARALRAAAPSSARRRADAAAAETFVEPGDGVSGKLEGRILRFGRPEWSAALSETELELPPGASPDFGSTALLADEHGGLAWFEFEMPLRPNAGAVMSWLKEQGYASSLLSGDPSQKSVAAVARELEIEDASAGVSPEEKLAVLDDWIANGDIVVAVGDGVNDAPLLGRAQVSLAMGSGSDLARLGADAVLLDDRLATIPLALAWARNARKIMRQNFAWALAYNLCVLPLAAAGLVAPYLAAIGMSLSSLLVVGNS
ncbi:MAG: cation-translocating P-type ATPase, partial [Deltaproteobacteria bacterium]|nr:cation-translocating P-type ATPase [Deltaproteobacteria bacterium]